MDKLIAQKAISYKKQLSNTEISEDERVELEQQYSVIIDKTITFLSTDEVLSAFKQSYSETFTESELRDPVNFFKSPTGESFLACRAA